MNIKLPRRQFIKTGVALPAAFAVEKTAFASGDFLSPTPDCTADAKSTPPQTAGPFFTPNTPHRKDFRADDKNGTPFQLVGFIRHRDCSIASEAMIELWHADSDGRYDNKGYRLRGHQFSDEHGRFIFHTTVPGDYPGRTSHFHVTVQPKKGRRLTTQLYFPANSQNKRDGIFDPRLVMDVAKYDDVQTGRFDFVI